MFRLIIIFAAIAALILFIHWLSSSKRNESKGASSLSIFFTGVWWLICFLIPLAVVGIMDINLLDNLLLTEALVAVVHFAFGTIYAVMHWRRMNQDALKVVHENRHTLDANYQNRPHIQKDMSWEDWLRHTGHMPQISESKKELAGRGLMWIYYLTAWLLNKVWYIISNTGKGLLSIYDTIILKHLGSLFKKMQDRMIHKDKDKK